MRRDDDLRAGDLTTRVTLRAPTWNPSEDEIIGFATVIAENVPAFKRELRAREVMESGRDVSEHWTEFRIRFRKGLDAAQRLDHDGHEYDIDMPVDPTGNRRVIVITGRVVR